MKPESMQGLARMSSVGVEFAAAVGIGTWLGVRADVFFRSTPTLTVIGLFFGIAVGFLMLYRAVTTKPGGAPAVAPGKEESGEDRG